MTPVLSLLVLCLVGVGVTEARSGKFFISASSSITKGTRYPITVDIIGVERATVVATLQNRVYSYTRRTYDVTILYNVSDVFEQGKTGKLYMDIDENVTCSSCRLHVRGANGLVFERNIYVSLSVPQLVPFIQTDKSIYKPGQTIRFRAFAVFLDLQLYKGTFQVQISDPNGNIMKEMKGLRGMGNVAEGSFDLGDDVVFGTWSIVIRTEDPQYYGYERVKIVVEKYELPKFEITIELPPYGLTSDTELTGSVIAKYTFGQPVKGMVELHIGRNSGPDYCGNLPDTTQITFEIDGNATFSVSRADIYRSVRIYDGTLIRVTAFVTEENTGIRLNQTATLRYYSSSLSRAVYRISFLESNQNAFKPGLPYTAFIQVKAPDGTPPPADEESYPVTVTAYATSSYTVANQSDFGTSAFTCSEPILFEDFTLPPNGVLPFNLDIPYNATYVYVRARYRGRLATRNFNTAKSNSKSFLQVTLMGQNLRAGSRASFKVAGTEALTSLVYFIYARGTLVKTGSLNGRSRRNFNFNVDLTPAMAPTARLVVYYVRADGEIVADSLAFKVEGLFQNEVSVSFNKNRTGPYSDVTVEVTADKDSTVQILAVDQSVLLLKDTNDITVDKIDSEISSRDYGPKPSDSKFPLSFGSNVRQIFSQLGLTIISDLSLPYDYNGSRYRYRSSSYRYRTNTYYGTTSLPGTPYTPGTRSHAYYASRSSSPASRLASVQRVRNLFPDVWLWTKTEVTGDNRTAQIHSKIPDTITSWVASAFATNPVSGLGIAPTYAKITVFRQFFVSLNYPSVMTRNEQAVIQATVFNYLSVDVEVTITLKVSQMFRRVNIASDGRETLETGNEVKQIKVSRDDQGVVYFAIQATSIGVIDVEISAQSTVAADAVRRKINVVPEGVPVSFNQPFFINTGPNTSRSYDETATFSLPDPVVEGSEKVKVKVTGDLIGSSLDSLTSLLRLPTGCAEQSMVKFAPDLYIAQYLKATGQLTAKISTQITTYLNYGHQRIYTYQRYDGGFSVFGNSDASGSTWLTAFVARVFSEATEFIYVYPSMLSRAINWLLYRQNSDGSFNEVGKVIDRYIKDTDNVGLTAYVILALLQNIDECNQTGQCYGAYRWSRASDRAINYVENYTADHEIKDQYTLAVVSYSLFKAKSSRASIVFNQLLTYAKKSGSYVYWSVPYENSNSWQYRSWRPSQIQARPIDILISSYAILSYTITGRLQEAFPIVQWLLQQRNSNGGFVSSQDTVVGLQALAAYATASIQPSTNLNINVYGGGDTLRFSVTRSNALQLQIQELPPSTRSARVTSTGTGLALVEIEHSFYIISELTTAAFEVSVVILDEDVNYFTIMVCTKYLVTRQSGMVVQEISIPAGFQPKFDSLRNVAGLKRHERRGNLVAVYFDQITYKSLCYRLEMTRSAKVARSRISYVKTYDYYEPYNQATVFYNPMSLKTATICDVCSKCCPPGVTPRQVSPPPSPPETTTFGESRFSSEPTQEDSEPETTPERAPETTPERAPTTTRAPPTSQESESTPDYTREPTRRTPERAPPTTPKPPPPTTPQSPPPTIPDSAPPTTPEPVETTFFGSRFSTNIPGGEGGYQDHK